MSKDASMEEFLRDLASEAKFDNERIMNARQVTVAFWDDRNRVTTATAFYDSAILSLEEKGAAIRFVGDKWDPQTGALIAGARALKRLARRMEREANRRVAEQDRIAKQKRRSRLMTDEEMDALYERVKKDFKRTGEKMKTLETIRTIAKDLKAKAAAPPPPPPPEGE